MAKQMRLFPSDFVSTICFRLFSVLSILSARTHFYRIKIDDTFSINLFTVLFYYFNSTILKSDTHTHTTNTEKDEMAVKTESGWPICLSTLSHTWEKVLFVPFLLCEVFRSVIVSFSNEN